VDSKGKGAGKGRQKTQRTALISQKSGDTGYKYYYSICGYIVQISSCRFETASARSKPFWRILLLIVPQGHISDFLNN
jgi:hypothetical protein